MSQGYIPLGEMRPWWLRLGVLLTLASPLLTGGELHLSLHAEHPFSDLGRWTAYATLIWLFIFLCVGLSRLLAWLGAAAIFGLGLVMSGALLSYFGVWEVLQAYLGAASQASGEDDVQRQLDLFFRLLMVMSSFPLFMLTLHSFSAAGIFTRAVRRGTRSGAMMFVSLAVFLRLFQHVFEVFEGLLLAWEEENPRLLLPRHRADMARTLLARSKLGGWWKTAVFVWCQALLMHSLLFVPVAVREWQQFIDQR